MYLLRRVQSGLELHLFYGYSHAYNIYCIYAKSEIIEPVHPDVNIVDFPEILNILISNCDQHNMLLKYCVLYNGTRADPFVFDKA